MDDYSDEEGEQAQSSEEEPAPRVDTYQALEGHAFTQLKGIHWLLVRLPEVMEQIDLIDQAARAWDADRSAGSESRRSVDNAQAVLRDFQNSYHHMTEAWRDVRPTVELFSRNAAVMHEQLNVPTDTLLARADLVSEELEKLQVQAPLAWSDALYDRDQYLVKDSKRLAEAVGESGYLHTGFFVDRGLPHIADFIGGTYVRVGKVIRELRAYDEPVLVESDPPASGWSSLHSLLVDSSSSEQSDGIHSVQTLQQAVDEVLPSLRNGQTLLAEADAIWGYPEIAEAQLGQILANIAAAIEARGRK